MSQLISLPDGNAVDPKLVFAVRVVAASPKSSIQFQDIPDRVIVEYRQTEWASSFSAGVSSWRGNDIVLPCLSLGHARKVAGEIQFAINKGVQSINQPGYWGDLERKFRKDLEGNSVPNPVTCGAPCQCE